MDKVKYGILIRKACEENVTTAALVGDLTRLYHSASSEFNMEQGSLCQLFVFMPHFKIIDLTSPQLMQIECSDTLEPSSFFPVKKTTTPQSNAHH